MSTLYWCLWEAARWLENVWRWPESGTVPPPDVHFCHGGSRNRRKYWRIIGNSSHITHCSDANLTHHYTSEVSSVGLCQRLCLVGRVDLIFVTAGNETDSAHKIWRERLLAWNIFLQEKSLSLIGGRKEFEIMVAEFVLAVSSSTHFSVSNRCRWKRCATNIITYSFKYNNNTFLSPYNALALKFNLLGTILDASCYC